MSVRCDFWKITKLLLVVLICAAPIKGFNAQAQIDTIHISIDDQVISDREIQADYELVCLTAYPHKISTIIKMEVVESGIYLADQKHHVYAFDHEGALKYRLNKAANKEEGHTYLTDISVNETLGYLEVMDLKNKIVYRYQLHSGKLMSSHAFDFWASEFSTLPNGNRLFYKVSSDTIPDRPELSNHALILTDENNKVKRGFLDRALLGLDKVNFITQKSLLPDGAGALSLIPIITSHIYKWTGKGVEKRYFLDFGEFETPGSDLAKKAKMDQRDFSAFMIQNPYPWHIDDFYESELFITFNFRLKSKGYSVIYDKVTEESVTYSDIAQDKHLPYFLPRAVWNQYHVSVSSYLTLEKRKLFLEFNVAPGDLWKMEEYRKILTALDARDKTNPLLVLSKFKGLR